MARGDDQINVRLSPERYASLEAAAFVDGMRSPGELVRAHVEALADRVAEEPAVVAALRAREQRAAERGSGVSPLRVPARGDGVAG